MTKRRLHWVTWQPTPYHNYFLANLAKTEGVELQVHYLKPIVSSHPWRTVVPDGYLSRYCRFRVGVDWHLLWLALTERKSFFVIAGWNQVTLWILLGMLRLLNRDYAVWTDTPNTATRRSTLFAYSRAAFLRQIFGGARAIMGTGSRAVALLGDMGAPRERLVNLPTFPDLHGLRRSRSWSPGGGVPLRIISVGYLVNERKGHDLVIRSLAAALRQPRPFDVHLSIAGTGPDAALLAALAQELSVERNVTFLGWLEPEDVRALYRKADLLIHPSPLHDPYPNAVLDAMAAGLVTFVSDVCGPAHDRITHGVSGFVHRAGDGAQLTAQLTELLDDANRISEIGARARSKAEEWPVERGVDTIREMVGARDLRS